MRPLWFVLLALSLTLLAAACGGGGKSSSGGGSVPSSDAAVVNGEHISQAVLDRRLAEAKCSYELQKRAFPKAGSQEYQSIQQQVLQNFVQRIELKQKAPSLDVSVSDKQVEDQLKSLKKQYFGGDEKKYLAELKKQCVTDTEVREDIRANLLSNAIFNKVTAGSVVTAATVKNYYDAHREVYTSPQTRVVSHILVKDKSLADKLYAQLKGGASFAALAKKCEAGADDVQVEGKAVEITAPPAAFEKVKTAVEQLGVSVDNAEVTMQAKQTVAVGEDKAAAVLRLMESLEEDDDVQQVYANFDIPTNVLERISAQV